MSELIGIRRLLFAATTAVVSALVVAACAIQLRGDDDSAVAATSVTQLRDPVAAELERCRTVTSEQVADIQECRRVWAENRRRFLGQRKAPGAPSIDAQSSTTGPSSVPSKDPRRDFWDTTPVATPKSE
ncbi:putative entry exclusion protein TrbK-alt [Bradyrhizobium sp. AZCC 1719]|uniref:putative entry exclusion protein TrbK-alt n=1 Tax=Bradyrhizobium sp. AZCC 1719 TaxID=3117028 RepID=UPI003FA5D78B